MIWGIDFALLEGAEFTKAVAKDCFDLGLIIECAGRNDTVLKLLPPLTIEYELLQQGCQIIKQAITHSVRTKV
jgi:diaminobutyrate-2-oxoglutarate transaminase